MGVPMVTVAPKDLGSRIAGLYINNGIQFGIKYRAKDGWAIIEVPDEEQWDLAITLGQSVWEKMEYVDCRSG